MALSACVLDADVIIGALDRRDVHHARAAHLIERLAGGGATLWLSVVNYAEALVRPAEDESSLRKAIDAIADIGVEVMPADAAIGREAARIRRLNVSLTDGFAIATAHRLGSSLSSFDDRVRAAAKTLGIAVV